MAETKTVIFGQTGTRPYGELIVTETGTSTANNTSTVSIKLILHRPYNISSSATKTAFCSIDGQNHEWSGSVGGSGDKTLIDTSQTVTHNSDGNKSISISASITLDITWSGSKIGTISGSDTMTLTKIPRQTTITTFTVSKRDETSFTFNWKTADTIDYVWYSTNNGSSWTGYDVTDGTSGSFNVTGLSANTSYNCKLRVRRKDSQLTTDSSMVAQTTYNYPYCTDSPSFAIGDIVTLKFYNPLNRSFTFYIIANGTEIENHWQITGTSYSGLDATSTQNQLYATIQNSLSGKYQVKVVYGSSTKTRTNNNTYSIKSGSSNPIFSNFTYEDINEKTYGLTNSRQILVNGYSNVTATISTANKAVANNSAIMTSYTMSIGSQASDPEPYSDSSQVQLSLPKVNSGIVIISAKDSRGNSTTVQKGNNSSLFKNYTDLVIKSVTATRGNNGVGKVVTLSYNGTFWNASFGNTTNTIKTMKYYYKLTTASSWTTGDTTLTKTVSGNNWSGSVAINGDLGTEGFNISNAYNIRLEVSDELSTKTFDVTLTSGTPAMSIYKNNIAIGKKYDTSQGGALQIGGKVGGDIYFNNNNSSIIWKENGYGDKFRIIPDFRWIR